MPKNARIDRTKSISTVKRASFSSLNIKNGWNLSIVGHLNKNNKGEGHPNNTTNNITQDLQMPFQPWTGFLEVPPKSFCSRWKHLLRFISDQCSLSVHHVTMADLHAGLLGFQPHSGWLPSCLAGPASDRIHHAFCCVGHSGNGWQFPRCAGLHEQIGKDRLQPAHFL